MVAFFVSVHVGEQKTYNLAGFSSIYVQQEVALGFAGYQLSPLQTRTFAGEH